jgi:hypothetical protein
VAWSTSRAWLPWRKANGWWPGRSRHDNPTFKVNAATQPNLYPFLKGCCNFWDYFLIAVGKTLDLSKHFPILTQNLQEIVRAAGVNLLVCIPHYKLIGGWVGRRGLGLGLNLHGLLLLGRHSTVWATIQPNWLAFLQVHTRGKSTCVPVSSG